MATSNPLRQLSEQGGSVWVDSIARDWLERASCAGCATTSLSSG